MSERMGVGVGVIGAGTISNQYLENLTRFPDLDVRIVADLFPEKAAEQRAATRDTPVLVVSGHPELLENCRDCADGHDDRGHSHEAQVFIPPPRSRSRNDAAARARTHCNPPKSV